MPVDSVVDLGSRTPQSVPGLSSYRPLGQPTQNVDPLVGVNPRRSQNPAPPPAAVGRRTRGRLSHVRMFPGRVQLHPNWRGTSLAPALGPCCELNLQHVTPAMLRGLDEPRRATLMRVLSASDQRIRWSDAQRGHFHHRRVWGLPLRHYHVSAATGLILRMSQEKDPTAFRDTLLAGLLVSVDELHGAAGAHHFTSEDVAFIIGELARRTVGAVDPEAGLAYLVAGAALVQHYVSQSADERAGLMQQAMMHLMQALTQTVPRDSATVGLTLGMLLAGGFRYASTLASKDFRRRRRVASLANLVWAMTNFIPVFYASGPAATLVVGSTIWWDYRHPPRDYGDVVKHVQAKIMLLAAQGRLEQSMDDVVRMQTWLGVALQANGY